MNKHYPTGRQTSYCMYRSRTKTAFCFSRISKFGLSSTRLPAGQCLVVLVQRLLLVHKERNFSSSIEGVCLRLGRIKNINNRLPMTHRKFIMYSAHYQKNCELSLLDFLIPIRSGILRNQSKWQSSQSHCWTEGGPTRFSTEAKICKSLQILVLGWLPQQKSPWSTKKIAGWVVPTHRRKLPDKTVLRLSVPFSGYLYSLLFPSID